MDRDVNSEKRHDHEVVIPALWCLEVEKPPANVIWNHTEHISWVQKTFFSSRAEYISCKIIPLLSKQQEKKKLF